jgi:hypothetical protein
MTRPLLAVGFERAFVGVAQRCGQPDLAVYDYDAAIAILVRDGGMPINDAVDYLEHNVLGTWMGEGSPLWITKMPLAQALESGAFDE